MADDKPQEHAAENAPQKPVSEMDPPPAPSLGPGPGPAPAASFPPSRPLYIPQFTAATQMILKRMKGEPSSLSAALSQASRSPSVTASIPSATYEDVKRRLVMGMNTSTQMTMQMPAAPPVRPPPVTLPAPAPTVSKSTSSTAGMSAIRKVTAGLTASSKPTPIKAAAAKVLSSESKIKKTKPPTAPRGPTGKRKRAKPQPNNNDDDDDDENDPSSSTSSLSSTPDPSSAGGAAPPPGGPSEPTTPLTPVPLTMTKSGRQVLKPAAYNPAAMDAAHRRQRAPAHHYGKRTAEQALCKKCSRMHSPATNQIVFCDGCNDGWHQLCHDPWIGDDIVRGDPGKGWFCGGCVGKREQRHAVKRQRVEQHQHHHQGRNHKEREKEKESWAGKPAQQKRAYLSTLPQQELVALLMACLEAHPDLPVFPAAVASSEPHQAAPRSIFAGTTTEGLFPRADAHPTGQINFVRKVAAGKGGKGSQKEDSLDRGSAAEDDEFDPLAALWPRAGMGMYRRLVPDIEDGARLVDEGDFEAFSVIVYDERGRKVEENGMKV